MTVGDPGNLNAAKLRSLVDGTAAILVTRLGMLALIGIGGWQLHSTQQMQIDIGVMKSQIADEVNDRYHGADAARDFARRDDRINTNTASLGKLWDAHNTLATKVDSLQGAVDAMRSSRLRGAPFP